MQNEGTGGWTPVVDLPSKALIDPSESCMVLRQNTLHVGRKYKLTCRVKNEGELCSALKEVKKVLCIQNGKRISMREFWPRARLQV